MPKMNDMTGIIRWHLGEVIILWYGVESGTDSLDHARGVKVWLKRLTSITEQTPLEPGTVKKTKNIVITNGRNILIHRSQIKNIVVINWISVY